MTTAQLSRPVTSNQPGIHSQLESVVRKHLASPFRKPFARHSLETFARLERKVSQHSGPLIFDSYCGVGQSTRLIAQANPEALVIGLDKSAHRLEKHTTDDQKTDNYLLVRADVDDIWRLAVAAGWRLQNHFLLYPNPWPKACQLQRRCHGSPLFASLLKLEGAVELRSNWQLYVEEFTLALNIAGHFAEARPYNPLQGMTPFEQKYLQSGHSLWRCTGELSSSL